MKLISVLRQSNYFHNCSKNIDETLKICSIIRKGFCNANGNLLIIQMTSLFWKDWEILIDRNVEDTLDAFKSNFQMMGPLLPFTSLLLPLSLKERLQIAQFASTAYQTPTQPSLLLPSLLTSLQTSQLSSSPSSILKDTSLRIGFISFDFNDHPTAHLLEAIFNSTSTRRAERKRFEGNGHSNSFDLFSNAQLIIYNYGKQDNSSYSRNLRNLADKYVEISELSYEESIETIKGDSLHILLDMQLHTLGNRLEITAGRPAPIQVNYLVYPGTSGASFMDYIVADRVVVAVEESSSYSESLLLLPMSYQISFYDSAQIDSLKEKLTNEYDVNIRKKYLRKCYYY